MISPRSWIVLGLGIVIAVGTAASLKTRMSASQTAADTGEYVMTATVDIPAGSFVRSDSQLAMSAWPKDHITTSMVTSTTNKVSDFNGAVARRAIAKGEPIVKNSLVRSNEGGFMSAVLDPGKRAVSIAVDPTSGNAGFIFPGDHVDLILTHSVGRGESTTRASETFIEDARVLAVDQSLDNPENKAVLAKTVTLEVTPKQAEEINLAKDLGKISLSLRSLATGTTTASNDITFQENLAEATGTPVPTDNVTRDTDISKIIYPENGQGHQVQLIRGSERTELQFGIKRTVSNAN